MPPEPYRRVPLHNRQGAVVAHALVDAIDHARVAACIWRYHNGYAWRSAVGGEYNVSMHRFVLGLGKGDAGEVDHANRDRLDNRRGNLRVGTHAENVQNVPSRGGTSIFRSVTFEKPRMKWRARVRLAGSRHHLGYFDDEYEAASAVAAFMSEHMPFAQPDPALAEYRVQRTTLAARWTSRNTSKMRAA